MKTDTSVYGAKGLDFTVEQLYEKDRIQSQHITNIERESEVLKNVVRDICTTLSIRARDLGHAALAVKYLELREELESIFPKRKNR